MIWILHPSYPYINVFQMNLPSGGTLYHTTPSLEDSMKPHASWKGKCVAVFRCKPKVDLYRTPGLVKYFNNRRNEEVKISESNR